jgi:hypothetical protein
MPNSLVTASFTMSSNDNALINQIVADVSGTSIAEANLLTQQEASMVVNAIFQVVATEDQAVNILNAFHVESNDPTSETASIIATMADTASARASKFRGALAALIGSAATGSNTQTHGKLSTGLGVGAGAGGLTSNMKEYFAELVRSYVNADLEADGFNNLLEAGVVSSITTSVNGTNAAADMYAQMDLSSNEVKLTNLIRQNDERDMEEYYAYIKEDNSADAAEFAPMKGGKTMTFVFDVQLSDPSSIKLKYVGTSPGGNGYQADPAGIKDRVITSASGGTVYADEARIAIIVQMDSKDNYFVRDISQGYVAESAYTGTVTSGNATEFAAAVKFYREAYLNSPAGFAITASPTFAGYTTTAAPTANSTKADAIALAYWQAVGQYLAPRKAGGTPKAIADVIPTIV